MSTPIVDAMPYGAPDQEFPDFAPFTMGGTCPEHGFQPVVKEGVTNTKFDPTATFYFACGCIDIERF